MNDLTRNSLEMKSFLIYRNGSNKAYLLSLKDDSGNIDSMEIEYSVAEKLQTGNLFICYSPSMANACQYQFVTPYEVLDKVVDENGNIIIIGEQLPNLTVKTPK
ncbi:MAG: hypothetical protein PHZ11_06655 [Desulfitobacteriaceae bacterium]|nr:hypothetical protein [Desulfitobacteriaceae bacterium]MDD4346555.1 hypothetical protein [Desulfitobacteriaceae bacterium]MDD4401923.1 hypothetical protein [Desulfitobacteriaceae bacterium]